MSLNKMIFFIYLFSYLLDIQKCLFDNSHYEPNPDNPKDNKKDNEEIKLLNELREKTNNITEECNNLKFKKEIYSFYIKLLLSINIIFGIILSSYIIYLCGFNKKRKYTIFINNSLNILNGSNNSENKEKNSSFDKNKINQKVSNEEELNNSGIEAPTIDNYYQNINY